MSWKPFHIFSAHKWNECNKEDRAPVDYLVQPLFSGGNLVATIDFGDDAIAPCEHSPATPDSPRFGTAVSFLNG